MEAAILAQNLDKIYQNKKGNSTHALKDISLNIPSGSFFALLGPNGAGKSTFINIIAGLVTKTSGSIKVANLDIEADMRAARKAIGIVPQELNLDPFFPPRKLLEVQAGLYGVPKNKRRSMELLELVGLQDKADSYARTLSGGMLRRLLVAKAMVHDPDILILDEPTAGVDVELRHMLWQQMKRLNKQGKTIVLTTHYLEEAQELCDHVAIINQGKLVTQDTKHNLMESLGNKELIVKLQEEQASAILENLKQFCPRKEEESWVFTYKGGEHASGKIIHALLALNCTILSVKSREAKLEDVFLTLTQDHIL